MMRWKNVSSKYFERASETNDVVVCGETLALSLIVNEPQLVTNVAVQVLFASSGFFGGLRSAAMGLGLGHLRAAGRGGRGRERPGAEASEHGGQRDDDEGGPSHGQ